MGSPVFLIVCFILWEFYYLSSEGKACAEANLQRVAAALDLALL
jgi:hypothetical protein